MMHVGLVTLFGPFFAQAFQLSVLGRAAEAGVFGWSVHDPRDHAQNRHRTVDDTPYGGGAGMVLRAPELAAATVAAKAAAGAGPVILLTPQGERLTQRHVRQLASLDAFVLVCGRYEGPDERFIERHVDVELSLGDFVLSGGEPAALALVDAVVRLRPGALGNLASTEEESHSAALLEYPHFTRPSEFDALSVPEVLTSGDHARIERWRAHLAACRTVARRPDLLETVPELHRKDRADAAFEPPAWMTRKRSLDAWIALQAGNAVAPVQDPDAPGDDDTGASEPETRG